MSQAHADRYEPRALFEAVRFEPTAGDAHWSPDQVFDGWGEDAIDFLARLKIAYEAPAKKK